MLSSVVILVLIKIKCVNPRPRERSKVVRSSVAFLSKVCTLTLVFFWFSTFFMGWFLAGKSFVMLESWFSSRKKVPLQILQQRLRPSITVAAAVKTGIIGNRCLGFWQQLLRFQCVHCWRGDQHWQCFLGVVLLTMVLFVLCLIPVHASCFREQYYLVIVRLFLWRLHLWTTWSLELFHCLGVILVMLH